MSSSSAKLFQTRESFSSSVFCVLPNALLTPNNCCLGVGDGGTAPGCGQGYGAPLFCTPRCRGGLHGQRDLWLWFQRSVQFNLLCGPSPSCLLCIAISFCKPCSSLSDIRRCFQHPSESSHVARAGTQCSNSCWNRPAMMRTSPCSWKIIVSGCFFSTLLFSSRTPPWPKEKETMGSPVSYKSERSAWKSMPWSFLWSL